MAIRRLPRPRDPLSLGKLIVDIATGQVVDEVDDGKNPAASALGGLKGGVARAKKLTAQQRPEIARIGGKARHAEKS
jgi:hypothetical protein